MTWMQVLESYDVVVVDEHGLTAPLTSTVPIAEPF
jgi:hypothetical protein